MNGFEFDNNLDEDDEAFTFQVGNGEVIRAWDEAFVGLKQGTVARIITPPDYAYGDQDVGDGLIPPNSTLMFDFVVHAGPIFRHLKTRLCQLV